MIWIYWRDVAIFYKHIVWSLLLLSDIEMLFKVETTMPATASYLVVFPRKQQFKQCFSSVQFSLSVKSYSLQPHGLQHARPPCPSPTPGACSNSCASSQWWHPTVSSSVIPFSSCLQSFPASESFPMSQLFLSGDLSIGASASATILSMNSQLISFRMDWLDLLAVQGTLKESSPTPQFKSINSLVLSFLYNPTLTLLTNLPKN